MKRFVFLALIGVFALSACNPRTEMANSNVIKIGVIGPMSGDAAGYGEESQRVLDYTLPLLNERVQDQGYRFELVYEDGQCDGVAAASAFQKLLDVDRVSFVIGGFCSSESLAIAPLLKEDNALAISAGSSNPALEGLNPNFFSLSYSDADAGVEIAHQLSQYDKVALLTEQNDYNLGLRDVVQKNLSESASQVVLNEEFAKGGTEFRNQLQKIKNSGAEVVFLSPNAGATAASMVRQLAEIQDWSLPVVSQASFLSEDVYGVAPDFMTAHATVVDAPQVTDPAFQAYSDAIVASKGTLNNLGSYYTASYADALNILADVIIASKGDVKTARDMISSGNFKGFVGDIHFGGHTFVQNIPTAVFKFQDGSWTIQ